MGIAEAIERVKRQARQSGLGAVIGEVGEHLRSTAVPSPLRGAAWRIANLLDAACPKVSAAPNERARELIHQDRAAVRSDVTRINVPHATGAAVRESDEAAPQDEAVALHEDVSPIVAAKAKVDVPVANVSSARVDESARVPAAEVSAIAVDSGASPSEPADGTAVDPRAVDATPTFNATPVQVEPVDATPTDDAPGDALDEVLEVSAHELVEVVASHDAPSAGEPMADERESARAEVAVQVEPAETARAAEDAAPREASGSEEERGDRAARAAEAARDSASLDTTAPATDVDELAHIDASLRADLGDSSAADAERGANASTPSQAQRAVGGAPKSSKPRGKGQGAKKRSTPPASAAAQPEKEKLAPSSEDAKNLARSTSRSTKRRSGAKADTSKKK